jgi:hypothetical protein
MTRPWLLAIGALLGAPAAVAQLPQQESRAHMEACVRWAFAGRVYSTRNSCDRPVTIMFMVLDEGRIVEGDVAPGGQFSSGAIAGDGGRTMMFTVCPTGYVPSVRFVRENAEPIMVSLYNCLPLGRPGA